MRIAPSLLAALAALAFPAAAFAAPPGNDNYLSSVPIESSPFAVTVDTTAATTQTDTYNPNREGVPFAGGSQENLACKGVSFGKTVWYDLLPTQSGAVELSAAATGFAPSVALYEYDPKDPKSLTLIDCTTAVGDTLQLSVRGGRAYTVQIGGVADAGGAATFRATYFQDRDEDEEFDQLDKCPRVAGTVDGCPPELKARPALTYDTVGSSARITRLYIDRVPKGATVVAKCGGCGSQTVHVRKQGRVVLSKLVGKSVASGRTVEIRVTLGKSGTGPYRFGATGNYVKYTFSGGRIGSRQDRCLNAQSAKIERCS